MHKCHKNINIESIRQVPHDFAAAQAQTYIKVYYKLLKYSHDNFFLKRILIQGFSKI